MSFLLQRSRRDRWTDRGGGVWLPGQEERPHARHRLHRRPSARTDGVSGPIAGTWRGGARDPRLGHVRQRPEVLPGASRPRAHRGIGPGCQQRADHRGARALRRGCRGGRGRRAEPGLGRHARHAASLSRLRRLPAVQHGLDAAVRRRRAGGLWRDRARRPCALPQGPGPHHGRVAGGIVVRGRGGHLLRHRHRLGRPAAAGADRGPDHRRVRAGAGRAVGHAARREDGRAGDRARHLARTPGRTC